MTTYLTSLRGNLESASQDHLYYNVDIVNNETIDNNKNDPLVAYTDQFSKPLIDDTSKWRMSIVRFQINGCGRELPIFIPEIELNQSNANKTIYKITILMNFLWKGNNYQRHITETVEFIPESLNSIKPSAVGNEMDLTTNYYFVKTYQHITKMINKTFEKIHKKVIKEVEAVTGINHSFESPRMVYESDGLFSIYLDKRIYGRKDDAFNPVNDFDCKARLFFNSNMYLLFSNFHNQYTGGDVTNKIEYVSSNNDITTDADGMTVINYKTLDIKHCAYDILPVDDKLGLNVFTYDSKSYWKLKQDYESTSSMFNPISAIVFTTNILSTEPEIQGNPLVFLDGDAKNETNITITKKIITDMSVFLESADSYSGTITYVPSAQYRYTDFQASPTELRTLQISCFWKHRLTGKLYPLKMPNKSSINIKFMFERR